MKLRWTTLLEQGHAQNEVGKIDGYRRPKRTGETYRTSKYLRPEGVTV